MSAITVKPTTDPEKGIPTTFKFTQPSLKKTTETFDAKGATGVVLRDTETRGLIFRKQKRDWVVALEKKIKGKIHRATLGRYESARFNLAAARAEITTLVGQISSGDWTPAEQRSVDNQNDTLANMTVLECVDLHERVNPHLRSTTLRSYHYAALYLTSREPKRMGDVTPDYVRRAYDRLLGDKSAATANNMLRCAKALWHTWQEEHPDDTRPLRNPFSSMTGRKGRTKKSNVREGAIPPAKTKEWFEFVEAEAVRMGPVATAHNGLCFLFLTGLRLREAMGLRWSEVGADEIRISGERMKNGERLVRPITPKMRQVLDRQAVYHDSEYVFPARVGDGHMVDVRKKMWGVNKAVLGAEQAVTPHDLRRGFVAAGALALVPDVIVKMLVGHSITGVTEGYMRALRSELPGMAEKIETKLTGAEQ